jgi:hypothetical protein
MNYPENLIHKPDIDQFYNNIVKFVDGSQQEIDRYCCILHWYVQQITYLNGCV